MATYPETFSVRMARKRGELLFELRAADGTLRGIRSADDLATTMGPLSTAARFAYTAKAGDSCQYRSPAGTMVTLTAVAS